jgi:hexosaminidase
MVQMSRYKYNTLHLHLAMTGWRIEIKSMPQLTSVGARRVKRSGLWGEFLPGLNNLRMVDFTQEDMREMIQYAKDRNITILPKMPGTALPSSLPFPTFLYTIAL